MVRASIGEKKNNVNVNITIQAGFNLMGSKNTVVFSGGCGGSGAKGKAEGEGKDAGVGISVKDVVGRGASKLAVERKRRAESVSFCLFQLE